VDLLFCHLTLVIASMESVVGYGFCIPSFVVLMLTFFLAVLLLSLYPNYGEPALTTCV
jgi:hypothetical protein